MTQMPVKQSHNRIEETLDRLDPCGGLTNLSDDDVDLLETPIEFMASPEFDEMNTIDDSIELSERCDSSWRDSLGSMPAYFADISRFELLDREQEAELFRKMNFLRFLAESVRCDQSMDEMKRVVRIRELLRFSDRVKDHLITANLRLVISQAKRFATAQHTIDDLASDGNLTLMRAVEKFDYSRGNKFSTYATWALRNTFIRVVVRRGKLAKRSHTVEDTVIRDLPDSRAPVNEARNHFENTDSAVDHLIDCLSEREKTFVDYRFGLSTENTPHTLESIAGLMGISKERVRQILARAFEKMRLQAETDSIEVPS